MKAVCIIASDNVVIDGDVCFINHKKSNMEYAMFCDFSKNSVTFKGKGYFYCNTFSKELGFKLAALWFWHMVVLRKSHVYLTGVLK